MSGLASSSNCSADDSVPAGADLIVSDVYWSDMFDTTTSAETSITSGQPYTISATVENLGTETSASFSATLYIDGAAVGGAATVDGLAALATASVSWPGMVTSDIGAHEVRVVADSEDSVSELNNDGTAEVNNERTEWFDTVLAEWTYAVYLDGDNNLELAGHWDFLEMAMVGSSPEVNIVVQFDRAEIYDTDYGDWTDAKRFLITRGMDPSAENAYEDLGEVNMGDASVLGDFASDAFGRFRSAQTCLVLWDHGASWYGGCCRDESASNDSLKTDEMREALTTATESIGAKVDTIGFDACVMESMEVCYAFEGLCLDVMGAESAIAGTGWPYDNILQKLVYSPSMTHEQLCAVTCDEFVIEYSDSSIDVLSAFDVDGICTTVEDALTEFADVLISGMDRYEPHIKAARNAVYGFDVILSGMPYQDTYSADLYTFAREVASHIKDEQVRAAAANLMGALEDARVAFSVVASYEPYSDIFGLMIFWPDIDVYLEEYTTERLSADTTWDNFLLAYYAE